MTDEFKQTLQEIVNLSDEQKYELGKDSLNRFLNGLVKGGIAKDKLQDIIFAFVKFFVSADRSCTTGEYNFFRAVTGIDISTDDFFNLTNGGAAEDYQKAAYEFASILNHEDKVALAVFGAALLSSDDTITMEEAEMLDRLLNS